MKAELTLEQSQKLEDLGIYRNSSDYKYSLTDLFSVLPNNINRFRPNAIGGNLQITGIGIETKDWKSSENYHICYTTYHSSYFEEKELIDCLYKLVCWYYEVYLRLNKDESSEWEYDEIAITNCIEWNHTTRDYFNSGWELVSKESVDNLRTKVLFKRKIK